MGGQESIAAASEPKAPVRLYGQPQQPYRLRGFDGQPAGPGPVDTAAELREIRQTLSRMEQQIASVSQQLDSLTRIVQSKVIDGGYVSTPFMPDAPRPLGNPRRPETGGDVALTGHGALMVSGARQVDSLPSVVPGDGRPKPVFISYCSKDKELVHPLVDRLAKGGLADRVWIDVKEIQAGSAGWRTQIAHAATNCRVAVVFLSPAYFASVPCSIELDIFAEKREGKQQFALIPVMVSGDIPKEFKFHLGGLQYIAWERREQLLQSICQELDRRPSQPMPPSAEESAAPPPGAAGGKPPASSASSSINFGPPRPSKPTTAAPGLSLGRISSQSGLPNLFGSDSKKRKEEDEEAKFGNFDDFGSFDDVISGPANPAPAAPAPASGEWRGALPVAGRQVPFALEAFFHFGRMRGEGSSAGYAYKIDGTYDASGRVQARVSVSGAAEAELELDGRHMSGTIVGGCRTLSSGALLRLISGSGPAVPFTLTRS